jgi:RIO kinase 1
VAVPNSLKQLIDDGVIDDVHERLMSGKEASVYVVSRQGAYIAAKVYKARDRRTFKATSSYTEGRNQTRNTRDKRAMNRKSSYGKSLMEESWRDMEYTALFAAHYAGVRVPKPIMMYEDVLLMELLLDKDDQPAPRLADFDLSAEEANAMLHEVYRQVRLLLMAGRIHGDLSAFNILMCKAGPTIIDLPQVVDAAGNNQAREILKRDLRNIVEHLARFDERLLRFVDCGEVLYQHYQRGTLEEATEPREVKREYSGGRRLRGQEGPDGFIGQARRGAPRNDARGGFEPRFQERGFDQGQRGPQQPQRGFEQGQRGPQQPQRGFEQGQRGPQQPQRGFEQGQRGPQQPQRGFEQGQRGPQQPQRGFEQGQRGFDQRGPQQPQRGFDQGRPPPASNERPLDVDVVRRRRSPKP